jgi:hypothetical protein
MAEWAADDRAAAGNARRSLALAGALVRVARMGAAPAAPLATALMADATDLAVRVERLLNPRTPARARRTRGWPAAIAVAAMAAAAFQPGTLESAHRVLEELMR